MATFDCTKTNLRKGDKGEQVTLLQKSLKTLGFYITSGGKNLVVDGDYGTYTEQAVKAFQKSVGGLALDGWVGPVTCNKLNEKLGTNEKTTTQNSSSSSTSTKTVTKVSTPKVDPYAPNTKNNVIPLKLANLTVDGIHFMVTNVTRTNSYHGGQWKSIELMNGRNYVYKGRPVPREYSVDCFFHNKEYSKISSELNKIGERICNVATKLFPSGYYTINVTVADMKVDGKKVTLNLTEYMV